MGAPPAHAAGRRAHGDHGTPHRPRAAAGRRDGRRVRGPRRPDRPELRMPGTAAAAAGVGGGFWANVMSARDAGLAADPRPALRRVHVPVLVLRGTCDYLSPEVARQYSEVLSHAVLREIDGAGHAIAHDRPDAYRELVTAFLL
ncbi:alpha/beta fold hydrolase [Nonomuraea thailandensis]